MYSFFLKIGKINKNMETLLLTRKIKRKSRVRVKYKVVGNTCVNDLGLLDFKIWLVVDLVFCLPISLSIPTVDFATLECQTDAWFGN